MRSSALLIGGVQDQTHRPGKRFPLGLLGGELFAPGRRESIEPSALALIGLFPGRRHPAFCFQSMERWVQRSSFDLKNLFGCLLDVFGDGVAMRGSPLQGSQDENVERALE